MEVVSCHRDTVAHIEDEHLNVSLNMEIMQNLTDALAGGFPNKTIYATFGNHDYHPTNQFPATGSEIYNRTAEMWKQWIQEEEQMNNFRKGRLSFGTHTHSACTGITRTVQNARRLETKSTHLLFYVSGLFFLERVNYKSYLAIHLYHDRLDRLLVYLCLIFNTSVTPHLRYILYQFRFVRLCNVTTMPLSMNDISASPLRCDCCQIMMWLSL